jgi:riboflavin transporter 2
LLNKAANADLSSIPFITKHFKKEYILAYYIGESLFAMIPSILALIQGVGEQGCHNVTKRIKTFDNKSSLFVFKNESSLEKLPLQPIFSVSVYYIIIGVCLCISLMAFIWTNRIIHKSKKHKNWFNKAANVNDINLGESEDVKRKEMSITCTLIEKIVLFSLNFVISFLLYGVQTGLQSYAALPYGDKTFHLSINLSKQFF